VFVVGVIQFKISGFRVYGYKQPFEATIKTTTINAFKHLSHKSRHINDPTNLHICQAHEILAKIRIYKHNIFIRKAYKIVS
jgi:hypothetical protein